VVRGPGDDGGVQARLGRGCHGWSSPLQDREGKKAATIDVIGVAKAPQPRS